MDNVHIITAGHSESEGGSPDNIWPQHDNLSKHGGTISAGKKTVNSYTVSTEYSNTGIMCHEIGHFLGLPDLYDTDGEGSGGLSPGLRGTSLMDNGCFNDDGNTPPNISALDLDIMGRKPTIAARKSYTLQPVSRGGEFLKIESSDENEYYLLECRVANNLGQVHRRKRAGSISHRPFLRGCRLVGLIEPHAHGWGEVVLWSSQQQSGL